MIAPILSDLPDIAQVDSWDCGAAVARSLCELFGVGLAQGSYVNLTGATAERGLSPYQLGEFLRGRGLTVHPRHGMSLADLSLANEQHKPVACCIQDYGVLDRSSIQNGHWVVVWRVEPEMVCVQDPARTPGRVRIPVHIWQAAWRDVDAEGVLYVRFGLVVSR